MTGIPLTEKEIEENRKMFVSFDDLVYNKIIYDIEGDNHGVRKISAHRANRDGRNKRH